MTLQEYIESNNATQKELAEKIGVTPGSVSHWICGKQVPAERCEAIEKATGGVVTCEELRSDLDWLRTGDGRAFYRDRVKAA